MFNSMYTFYMLGIFIIFIFVVLIIIYNNKKFNTTKIIKIRNFIDKTLAYQPKFDDLIDYSSHFESIAEATAGIPQPKKKKRPKLNKHEERCREIFQDIFRVPFKSCRPDFLKNPVTGRNLELDGYNATIKTKLGKGLAFEYDGQQHHNYNKHFHKSGPDEFSYQVKKDYYKDLKCKEKKILLIRIPHDVSYNDLERYIRSKLRRHSLPQ